MDSDLIFMDKAVSLGEMARLQAPPNPWVGCVIVKEGNVIGSGFTQPPGEPHAECIALQSVGEGARGATLFTTLEPCSHFGRTPPCADAIIAAGLSRVVVALSDPDIRVAGTGIAALQRAGIRVDVGVGAAAAAASLEPYLFQRIYAKPFCVLKVALSIDGRLAARDGSSQWITGEVARADAHRWRAYSQAIAIGAGTALSDRPSLTVRHPELKPLMPPLRVLFDAKGSVPAEGPLFDSSAKTLIFTTEQASQNAIKHWRDAGVSVEIMPQDSSGNVSLQEALGVLAQRGVLQLLVEGGAELHTSFLQNGLMQRLVSYVGNTLLGPGGSPFYRDYVASIAKAPRFALERCYSLGDSACIIWRPL